MAKKSTTSLSALSGKDPEQVTAGGHAIATHLADMIKQQKLSVNINGKEFVTAEGWTTMGAMLGVFPNVDWTKKMETPDGETAWEARVTITDKTGRVVGSGEAMCSNKELMRGQTRWKDEYAIRSMAQTRAISKAYRLPFSWIMKLAGYEVTPAEEIPPMETGYSSAPPKEEVVEEQPAPITEGQLEELAEIVSKTKYGNIETFNAEVLVPKGKHVNQMTFSEADNLIRVLKARLDTSAPVEVNNAN